MCKAGGGGGGWGRFPATGHPSPQAESTRMGQVPLTSSAEMPWMVRQEKSCKKGPLKVISCIGTGREDHGLPKEQVSKAPGREGGQNHPLLLHPGAGSGIAEAFPARWLLLTSSPGGHSDSRGGRWEGAEKPKSSEKASSFPSRRNPVSASTQFKDVSLPASLKPEPFPPRHVSLAVFPLFSFCFFLFFSLLLPLFLFAVGMICPRMGCRAAILL